jgi:23S rRNA pseudouridine1911/1915/1917 synthase
MNRGSGPSATLVVPATIARMRLDVYLHRNYPDFSRNALLRLIRAGAVRVQGRTVKPTHTPRAGEVITIAWPEPEPARLTPVAIALDVLYEDETLLVLNKPAGLVVHPAAGTKADTLVHALLHHCRGQLSGVGGVARPGIVHRLDRFTSGVMVVAKNDRAHLALTAQFSGRRVEKVYHAIVCGALDPPAGEIAAPIGRHPRHRQMMGVRATGRVASTSYRTLERLSGATLVAARLRTGRTHQVRVHFKHLGFPLVGDLIYGKKANARLRETTGFAAPRQMLHAQRLAFDHPTAGQRISFQAPWPADFRLAVGALCGHEHAHDHGTVP